jgi:hypothetical protein
MSGRLIATAGLGLALAWAGPARADAPGATVPTAPPGPTAAPAADPSAATSAAGGGGDAGIGDAGGGDAGIGDREIGAELGLASGGKTTPGGLRVAGRFLYQLSGSDWFDGSVAFTFGSGGAACFRNRADVFTCAHGALDGFAGQLGGGVRRFVGGKQGFRPWVRVGAAARVLRFGDDGVTGFAVPLSVAGGIRVRVADNVAVGGEAAFEAGPAWLGHGLGGELSLGFAVTALGEIALP